MTQKSYNKQAWRNSHSSAKVSYISSCAACLSFQPYVWYQLGTLFHSIKSIPSSKYESSYPRELQKTLKTGILVAEGAPCQYIWNLSPILTEPFAIILHLRSSWLMTISSSSIPTLTHVGKWSSSPFFSLWTSTNPTTIRPKKTKLSPQTHTGWSAVVP